MHGNVSEWVEDSVSTDYRVVRGGDWRNSAKSIRSSWRTSAAYDYFDNRIGFRVARTD
jgi:formylglycine-generating enzyme required for sulfatase activity